MQCALPGCDVEFDPRKGGKPQRYCCSEHRDGGAARRYWEKNGERIKAERQARNEAERQSRPEKVCARPGCSNTFVPSNRLDQDYCSVACRTKRYRQTPQYRRKAARSQARRAELPERQEYIRAWRRRGMTDDEFFAMRTAQDGRCAICGDRADELVLDHCHKRGTNRALLCRQCNLGLGHFRDDRAVLEAAIRYLDSHT